MSSVLKILRALADATRLRIVALLEKEELSVQELQEIMRLGQSRISTHLGLLQEAGILRVRREGRRAFYRLTDGLTAGLADGLADDSADELASGEATARVEILRQAIYGAEEIPEREADKINLRRVLKQREQREQAYFNQMAGRFDRVYGPGRSWQGFGHLLLRILPPLEVADLGSGEGLLSELLARRCQRVIAVDNSEKIVSYGALKARKNGLKNLEFRLGDLQNPPIAPGSVDLAIMSHSLHHTEKPEAAIAAAAGLLRQPGRLVVLDLLRHNFTRATELYGDRWPGFAISDLERWLEAAGLSNVEISVVAREDEPPHFETLLAVGEK